MDFGYFTLSDNNYANNTRSPNQFVLDILDEALYADKLRYNSAWIGEHHFSTLGVNSSPEMLLAYVAARTEFIRLAPAVTVLPMHHPIRVAEQWATLDLISGGRVDFAAGRGYDEREYIPFGADFKNNQPIFEEGMEILRRLWDAHGAPISHKGAHYQFENVAITPSPLQKELSAYVASFSAPSIELAGRLGCGLIVAPFAAAMTFGGLRQVHDLYQDSCARHGKTPKRLMCSYFIHFADNEAEEKAARARQIRSYMECVLDAFPSDPKTTPKSYLYFIDMIERLKNLKPENLNSNSVLIGNSASIIDTLKKVEAAGYDEVILYFNVGLKDHQQTKDEMERFMLEVAPHFQGRHLKLAAAAE
jgi:alkanesulfonate monooxygenase SsuD/methylene tetrahydromethanopterin reductase-like flavin-dependent oxidoreductase (luciferase family)